MQGYFKDFALTLSQRTNTVTGIPYKDEPAILAWELANEFRCPKCPINRMLDATADLAKYLKSLYPKYLIAVDWGLSADSVRAPLYDAWLTLFFNDTNKGSVPLFWQHIPASRSGDDGYGVTFGKDTATVPVFNKSAVPRALR